MGVPQWLSGKELPAMQDMQETWVWSLCWEDPMEEGMTTYSCLESPMDRGAWQGYSL